MSPNNIKPRLVTLFRPTGGRPFQSASADVRFSAMVEEHQRQRQMLTPREMEVLALLCEGLPNKLIERRLGIGAGTVKCHVANILSKLGVASRLQAVIEAQRRRLLANADSSGLGRDDILADRAELAAAPREETNRFASCGRSGD
jgi:DNA-binding NarL/FixJ family response regulator